MFVKITAPCGKNLGETPVNAALSPCDGSYGLLEHVGGNMDECLRIEFGLFDKLRDACEPVSVYDYNPQVGMVSMFEGYKAEVTA